MQTMTRNQSTRTSRILRYAALGVATAGSLFMTGCGAGFVGSSSSGPIAVAGSAMQGTVYGGQQPVTGATIQLYAANLTGYGASSYALLTGSVRTDSSGFFNITGDYTCPSSSVPVYLVATGGNAGSGINTALGLMTALGACGNLTPTTFISVNELTTVASAYALSAFMSSPTQLSTSPTNITGLTNAFATVNKLVNTGTGALPGSTLPTGATEPMAELNTLADILASCVNSSGGTCGTLFANAKPTGGTAPTETITAILDIARNPSHNAAALFNAVSSTPPFQPTLPSAPTDFAVALKYAPTGTFSAPSAAAVATGGDLWVTNSAGNTITVLNATTSAPTTYTGGGLSGPSGIAFDQSGNAWVTEKTSSSLSVFTPAGVGMQTVVVGLAAPTGLAIDGTGLIWITSAGNGGSSANLTVVGVSGTQPQYSQTYTSLAGINAPVAVAINPH